MSLKDNLIKARKDKNMTQDEVAQTLFVKRQTYSAYERGVSIPDAATLNKLAKLFGVSADELLGGNSLLQFDNIFPITKKRYPLLGDIACGIPIYADEDRESYAESGTDVKADFCLRAKGDSMIGARIMDGDIVFIRSQPMVNNGEVAAVIIDDEATLKRVYYYRDKNKIILIAENPKYEPLIYTGEEINGIRILGKAVAFQSDVI